MGKTQRKHRVKTVGEVLQIMLKKNAWGKKLQEHQMALCWDRIVGEKLAQHSFPMHIKHGILWVACDSAVWLQEMFFLKKDIQRKTNEFLKWKRIKDVQFKQSSREV